VHGFFHRGGLELTAHDPPALGARDEARIVQHIQMLHHGGQRHRKRLRQFADRQAFIVGEPHQKRPPGGVGKRCKRAVQRGILILNHVVKFKQRSFRLSTRSIGDHGFVRWNLRAMKRPARPSIAAMPMKEFVEAGLPLGKLPAPRDYTGSYVLLASPENSSTATGGVIICEGGMGIRGFGDAAGGRNL